MLYVYRDWGLSVLLILSDKLGIKTSNFHHRLSHVVINVVLITTWDSLWWKVENFLYYIYEIYLSCTELIVNFTYNNIDVWLYPKNKCWLPGSSGSQSWLEELRFYPSKSMKIAQELSVHKIQSHFLYREKDYLIINIYLPSINSMFT